MDTFALAIITVIISIIIAAYKRAKGNEQDAIFWILVAILNAICAFIITYQKVNHIP